LRDFSLVSITNCVDSVFQNFRVTVAEIGNNEELTSTAVKVTDSNNIRFDSVKISSPHGDGFVFLGEKVKKIHMLKCEVVAGSDALRITDTGGMFFIHGCRFRNNSGDSVYVDGNSSDYIIKSCFFYNNKGNDLQIRASRVLVENCTFLRTGGIPVLFRGKFDEKNGKKIENIIVCENFFDGVNSNPDDKKDFTPSCILFEPGMKFNKYEADKILIEENKLLNFPGYSVSLISAKNITVKGNLFINRTKSNSGIAKRGAITLDNVSNTVIKRNLWEGKLNKSPGVLFVPDNTEKFIFKDNLKE